MGALQRGPGGPWPIQNFGWVSHNAFGSTNNWPVCLLVKLGTAAAASPPSGLATLPSVGAVP